MQMVGLIWHQSLCIRDHSTIRQSWLFPDIACTHDGRHGCVKKGNICLDDRPFVITFLWTSLRPHRYCRSDRAHRGCGMETPEEKEIGVGDLPAITPAFFLFPLDTGHLISILSFKLKTGHLQPGMQSVSFQHPPDRFSPRGGRREQTGERGG